MDLPNLIESAQSGDVGAISELYDRYASMILRYLVVRVYEHELAQDLTQEVFIRIIKGIGQFTYRDEKSFLGWLYTIAGNVLNSYHRRKRVLATPLDQQVEVVDVRRSDDVRMAFDRIVLQQAIEQLTDDQQQVLMLRFFADMTNSEIATALNRTEGAIKALQYRALQNLHQILLHDEDRWPDQPTALRTKRSAEQQGAAIELQHHDMRPKQTIRRRVPTGSLETHGGD